VYATGHCFIDPEIKQLEKSNVGRKGEMEGEMEGGMEGGR
jgi:hypothetical protein